MDILLLIELVLLVIKEFCFAWITTAAMAITVMMQLTSQFRWSTEKHTNFRTKVMLNMQYKRNLLQKTVFVRVCICIGNNNHWKQRLLENWNQWNKKVKWNNDKLLAICKIYQTCLSTHFCAILFKYFITKISAQSKYPLYAHITAIGVHY